MIEYVELAVTTNFSFLRGASHAEELVERAEKLKLAGIGVADRNSFAGVVRAHIAAKDLALKFFVGVRLVATDVFETLAYPKDRAAYGRLCRLLTRGKRKAEKGECHISFEDILEFSEGQVFIVLPPSKLKSRDPFLPPFTGEVLSLSEARAKRRGELSSDAPSTAFGPPPPLRRGGTLARTFADRLGRLREAAPGRVYLGSTALYENRAAKRLAELAAFARKMGVPLVATNDVHYHVPERQQLQDVLTCIREKCTIDEAGKRLASNAERHLKSAEEMARLFAKYPDAVPRTMEIAGQLHFTLDDLKYEYPDDAIGGADPQQTITKLAWEGAAWRYPNGIPEKIRKLIDYELKLIEELDYARYFLTVWDIVQWAKKKDILFQGRGSAANSAVCYMLGITAVDPTKTEVLFERFISSARGEPPDIDVDFEHEQREKVIQYIYEKYGRERAGITATVICYRSKSAIRDVGKALGLSEDMVGLLSGNLFSWGRSMEDVRVEEVGLDASDPRLAMALNLTRELYGFPRHLSQHVGGFVITRGPLEELVPIGNAAMEDRTFIEWDKEDIDAIRMFKIDVLGLGMLTAIAKAFRLLKQHYSEELEAKFGVKELSLAALPGEDRAVYEMMCKADTIGVFQVESRAQMSMLPRLRPKNFSDIIIEVAIVRPGPIQGDMVHPYLRRREGIEKPIFPSKELEDVLKDTLGVPLFQEQAMKIAIVAAGFTAGEADQLRRAMATFKRSGTIPKFREKFINGMIARGYEREFAERCFHQIEGFADYGFPMSHAASFAQLVYVSAWIKRHYPDVFCAALLNAQPMGFYAPAQLVRDAAMHGVEIREPDINASDWDYTLEKLPPPCGEVERLSAAKWVGWRDGVNGAPPPASLRSATSPQGGGESKFDCAVRLGLRQIKGFREDDAKALVAARGRGFDGVRHLALAANLPSDALSRLAEADAFRSLGLDRREALWCVKGLDGGAENARVAIPELPIFRDADAEALLREEEVRLPPLRLGEHIVQDYMALSMSLKAHPLSLLRTRMNARGITPNAKIIDTPDSARITVAGLVLVRQRPGTASGVIFVTLEDEANIANIIVWPKVFETYRRTLLASRLLMVTGKLQKQGIVTHVIADRLTDLSSELSLLSAGHDDKCEALARADQIRHDGQGSWRDAPHRRRNAEAIPKSRDFR